MQVLSSLSGLQFSALSAGHAPTNSADVSAIASAYQVVSATATQLYAGTAYVTSVNDAPLSAARAGNAANASLANSAWYDGTGRLISSLPDSAAVSAIASAYAESAASGKQDELTFSYDDDKISAINGSALAGQGGGGLITSIQSSLDPWYQTSISGLNGSALYPRWAASANSAGRATSASYAASAPTAWASSFITGVVSPSGTIRVLDGTAIEGTNSAMLPSTVIPGFESASSINAGSWSPGTSIGPGVSVTGTIPSENPYTNLVLKMGWGGLTVSVTGDNGETASVSKLGPDEYVTAQLPNATSYTLTTDGWVTLYAITASAMTHEIGGGVGELAWASALPTYSYDSEDKISAINGSALGGQGGGVDSATVSAIASSYAESAASGKLDTTAFNSGDFYTTSNPSGFITGVDLSDYATTAYVDSSVSGKQDASAMSDYQPTSAMTAYQLSGDYYSASNPSGFLTGVDLSPYQTTADMSSYIPTSMSSDFQQASAMSSYALSSDVSATVDLVGTQSANWGGSALQLSAGPGVKLEKVGDTLVASTDETVLWSGANASSVQLSESYTNFERLSFVVGFPAQAGHILTFDVGCMSTAFNLLFPFGNTYAYFCNVKASFTTTGNVQVSDAKYVYTPFGTSTQVTTETSNVSNAKTCLQKIIGIHRTAEA